VCRDDDQRVVVSHESSVRLTTASVNREAAAE
jgi:hypothetical protein